MVTMIVALKSGRAIQVEVKDAEKFVNDVMNPTISYPQAENVFWRVPGMVINAVDVAAIYPKAMDYETNTRKDRQ